MSSDELLNEKTLKKLDRKLQEIISRTGIDKKTLDEVFDKYTLLTIEKFISDKIFIIVDFPISTGKEGNIFRGVKNNKKFVAIKIYRTSTSTFKHIQEYILGDPRFKTIRKTRKDIVFAWAQKEFKNLQRLKKIGVRAPKPIAYRNNVLVMEYIGTKTKPAPLLKDVTLINPKKIFEELIDFISKMYKKAELVHGDISAFNVLIHKNKPYIIDLGQGILTEHPNALDFLKRDIKNIVRYFKKYNIQADENKIYKKIVNNN